MEKFVNRTKRVKTSDDKEDEADGRHDKSSNVGTGAESQAADDGQTAADGATTSPVSSQDQGDTGSESAAETTAIASAAAASSDTQDGLTFSEVEGDLFECGPDVSLAHCISADVRMGKGIAVIFKRQFGGVEELKKQAQLPGGVAVLKRDDRYIYYLVTKKKANDKPKYDSLYKSLQAMKKHCVQHSVKKISMPMIGCGLDGLNWTRVAPMIRDVFKNTDMTVTVYSLPAKDELTLKKK